MKNIRDVVLQEIESSYNPYQLIGLELDGPNIEIMSKCGFPAIIIDFAERIEIYRSSDPDAIITLDPADPDFIERLFESLDSFYVPRKAA